MVWMTTRSFGDFWHSTWSEHNDRKGRCPLRSDCCIWTALAAVGIQFTISTLTEHALERIRARTYDVIISDIGRPLGSRAGYNLLDEKKKLGDQAPFIIYAGSNRPEHKAEAQNKSRARQHE
jgi:CheY-like chemotaxis protein